MTTQKQDYRKTSGPDRQYENKRQILFWREDKKKVAISVQQKTNKRQSEYVQKDLTVLLENIL